MSADFINLSLEEAQVKQQELLIQLEQLSYVAHRDATEILPLVEKYGVQASCYWLDAAYKLFVHDRDAGKPFIRQTPIILGKLDHLDWIEQAIQFTTWTRSWQALEGYLEHHAEIEKKFGKNEKQQWFEEGMLWCEGNLVNGTTYFNTPLYKQLNQDSIQELLDFLQPAHMLYNQRNLPLALYLKGATQVKQYLGLAGLINWARMGADILKAGRSRGEAFFALESEESASLLLANLPGFSLNQSSRFWRLLLQIWFEETFPLQEFVCFPKEIPCMLETDGKTIFTPPVLPDKEYALLAILHTAGHIYFGSYNEESIQKLFQYIGIEHPPVDQQQRITWRPLFIQYGENMFKFQVLFDICEDIRINYKIAQNIPHYLQRLIRLVKNYLSKREAVAPYLTFAQDNLQALLTLDILDSRLQPLLNKEADLLTAYQIAEQLYQDSYFPTITIEQRAFAYLPAHSINVARAVYPRRLSEGKESVSKEETSGNPFVQKEENKKKDLPKEAYGNDPDLDIPPEETAGSGGRVGVGIPVPSETFGRGIQRLLQQEGIAYPEWDYRIQDYLPQWTYIIEQSLKERNESRALQIQQDNSLVLKQLQRVLQQQKPQRQALKRKQLEGDALDIEACVDYIMEKKAGLYPKPFIYKQRIIQHRDIAVLLLADLSTSIMAKTKTGIKVVESLRAATMLFAEALEIVGDAYMIAGFASKYHDQVFFYNIKSFQQKLTHDIRAIIAGMTGRLASRMGAAIRHSITHFKSQPAEKKLLLILSDGRPADYDDGGDIRYLHEDTRKACKEALDQGIHPFCITLDPAGSEYLPNIFGPGHYLILEDISSLPRRLPEIYLRLKR